MEEEKQGKHMKGERQGMLKGFFGKSIEPVVFTQENILHIVTQFIAVDDQVSTHQHIVMLISSPTLVPCCHKKKQCSEIVWLQ